MIRQNCEHCLVLGKSLLNKVEKKDLLDLSQRKNCIFYKKGQTIFSAGTKPNGVYCLNQGKVKIYKYGSYGKEQIIRFVSPGEFFGMKALLSDRTFKATATTLEDSVVCILNKNDFFELLNKYPLFSTRLMILFSQMLEEADNKLTSMAQKTVRERLAESLLVLNKIFYAEKNTNNYPDDTSQYVISLSREDLANIVGTSTETVIRLLSKFKKDNFIKIKGRKITLINIKELIKIAEI
ncbi:MAG: Crp/Fnr family transcriptional regulator [Bacteroidia bacterium]|nr:Crp/Fnr family transcriptional regulator [Bacteroidia bacterium]